MRACQHSYALELTSTAALYVILCFAGFCVLAYDAANSRTMSGVSMAAVAEAQQ